MNSRKKYHKRPMEAHNVERLKSISGIFLELRLSLGYSREEMQNSFSISKSVIERAESLKFEHLNQNLKTILEMADIYQISPEELFQGVG